MPIGLHEYSLPHSSESEFGSAFHKTCLCGRTFNQSGPFNYHKRTCKESKRRLSGALVKAKEAWTSRKQTCVNSESNLAQAAAGPAASAHWQARINMMDQDTQYSTQSMFDVHHLMPEVRRQSTLAVFLLILGLFSRSRLKTIWKYWPLPVDLGIHLLHQNQLGAMYILSHFFENNNSSVELMTAMCDTHSHIDNNTNLSLAERRPRREGVLLPKRYRDILPQPLAPLARIHESMATTSPPPSSSLGTVLDPAPSPRSTALQTPQNVFGLLRQYYSNSSTLHDPEELVELNDLAEIVPSTVNPLLKNENGDSKNLFFPYPNKNSFLLGEWYWNGGAQKSRDSFRDLVNIVGDPAFFPEDVQKMKWAKIDGKLAHNDDGGDNDNEWLDEDIGWKRSPISISVPFHSRTVKPGAQTCIVGHLYHRSLVSVIREKLANQQDMQHFHYEPYKLFWRPNETSDDVRVYGEIYTSPAFLEAQRELRDLPGEPGCNLPRVVVAMMLWSDATHLTSFGTAKLWPCYLFFGNESKYRRCKPSCRLCSHVAYFETVRPFSYITEWLLMLIDTTAP